MTYICVCECTLKNTRRYHFIYSGKKDIWCIWRTPHNLCFIFHKIPFISKFYIFSVQNNAIFINHALKFENQLIHLKAKHTMTTPTKFCLVENISVVIFHTN